MLVAGGQRRLDRICLFLAEGLIDRRRDDDGVVVHPQSRRDRRAPGKGERLLGGVFGPLKIEGQQGIRTDGFEGARGLRGHREIHAGAPGGVHKGGGTIGRGGKQQQQPHYFLADSKYGFAPEAWSVMSTIPCTSGMCWFSMPSIPWRRVTLAIPHP